MYPVDVFEAATNHGICMSVELFDIATNQDPCCTQKKYNITYMCILLVHIQFVCMYCIYNHSLSNLHLQQITYYNNYVFLVYSIHTVISRLVPYV